MLLSPFTFWIVPLFAMSSVSRLRLPSLVTEMKPRVHQFYNNQEENASNLTNQCSAGKRSVFLLCTLSLTGDQPNEFLLPTNIVSRTNMREVIIDSQILLISSEDLETLLLFDSEMAKAVRSLAR